MGTDAIATGFELLLRRFPEPASILAADGEIIWSNELAIRELALGPRDSLYALTDLGSQRKLSRLLDRVVAGEDIESEIVFVVDSAPVLYQVHLFNHDDQIVLVARRMANEASRFIQMSELLSSIATLYRESSRQRHELERNRRELTDLSQSLANESRRLLSIIDQLPEGIVIVNDDEGGIRLVNSRILELWRLPSEPEHLAELSLAARDGTPVPWDQTPIMRAVRDQIDVGPVQLTVPVAENRPEPVFVQALASPIHDPSGRRIGAAMSIVDLTEQERLRNELATQAVQDPLTGLGNRRMFFQQVEQSLGSPRSRGSLALMYIDLDGFKTINDSLGHDAGDAVLIEVAARLKRALREQDVVARLGGDEFATLLEAVPSRDYADSIASRMLACISDPIEIQGRVFRLSASIGIAFADAEGAISASELVRRADVSMYSAKSNSSSRWAFFDELTTTSSTAPISLSDEIHRGLEAEQFEMLYRPIIDLRSGRVAELEIALFWRHPNDGLLDDVEIRARAWRTGLLHVISERAADLAERDRGLLLEALGTNRRLTMTRHFWVDHLRERRIVEGILAIAKEISGTPIHVRMELSGRISPEDHALLQSLEDLHSAGIELGIAHAGSHDGDLSLLWRIPISSIVVSRELLLASGQDARAETVARSIARLAAEFGIQSRAPGIEDEPALQRAKKLGFTTGSGARFSPPLSAVEFLDFRFERVFTIDS